MIGDVLNRVANGSVDPAKLALLALDTLGIAFLPSTGESNTDEKDVEGERRYWSGGRTGEAPGGRDVEER